MRYSRNTVRRGWEPFFLVLCLRGALCILLYVCAMFFLMQQWILFQQLQDREHALLGKIRSIEKENQMLQESLSLRDDPDWQQSLLMQELGMVPFGAIQIQFKDKD